MNRGDLDFVRGRPLSPRQLETLRHAAQGRSQEETARAMRVSLDTVKTLRRLLLAKLGARNVAHAVALAYDQNLFRPSK
jgi:DNA-binding CsgD family transcriptional regulator